jgi:hypothetical protein
MVSKMGHLFGYNFKYEVHSTSMQNVCKDSCGSKQNYVKFFGIKSFHQLSQFLFNAPLHLT